MLQRVRTPTIIQIEPIECGAVSLGIILGYYGRYVTLEQLRIACGIMRDGSLPINILKAAQKYALEGQELSCSLEELKQLQPPFIINWHYNHYVVFEGFSKTKIFINDPAFGPRKISFEELKKNFTERVLTFSPAPSFIKEGKPISLLRLILKRFQGCKGPLTYLFICGLLLIVPGIALPTFTRFFVDSILMRHLTSTAFVLLVALICSALATGVLTALQGYYLARLNSKISIRLSSQFLWHILRLPIEFYVQRHSGEIAYRLTVTDKVVSTLTAEIARAFINLLLIAAYGTFLFFYDTTLACIGIGIGVFNLLVLLAINRARTDANIRLQQDMGKRVGISIGGLQNIETIKAVAAESDFFSRWAGYFTKTINTVQEIGKLDIYLTVIPPFTQFLAAAAVLTIGGTRVIEGKMTLGMLLGLQTLMQIFLAPISRYIYLGQRIQNVKGGLYRIEDVLTNPIDSQFLVQNTKDQEITKLNGEVQLKKISFGYNTLAPPLIENFDLHIKPGESVALVGPSGCGKSTIARLITGLYQPWSGEILFDNTSLNALNRHVIHRSIAAVDQRIFVFGGTVRDNLTLWDETLPEEDLIQAAIDAQIHTEIIQRAEGYNSIIIEGGKNFSGGQLQCLEIARSLALNPSFLILDEATSSLDSDTEAKIIKKIRQRGCACLIIAHRLSTIRDCNEIIVLDRGRVMQRGTHETLKNTSPLYQELIKLEGIF